MTATYNAEVEQIVPAIFATMLNLEIVPIQPVMTSGANNLVTAVQITGEWVGSVVFSMSPSAARAAAAAMLQVPAEEVSESDLQDVAAELVNMIGGNLKSLLPGPSNLSLPTVVAGREFGLRVHDAKLIDDVWFCSEAGPLHVALFAKCPSDKPNTWNCQAP